VVSLLFIGQNIHETEVLKTNSVLIHLVLTMVLSSLSNSCLTLSVCFLPWIYYQHTCYKYWTY